MKRVLTVLLLLICGSVLLSAQMPPWLTKRLRSDDHFLGRGSGPSVEEAEFAGKQEILLQLSSQVNAAVGILNPNVKDADAAREKVDAFIDTVRLRDAEVAERYQDGEVHYALIKYPEDCGLSLARSVVMLYQEDLGVEVESVIGKLDEGAMIQGGRVERVISDASSGTYGNDVFVGYSGNILRIQALNFNGYGTALTPAQRQGLKALSDALLPELKGVAYRPVGVTGHANPTGTANENTHLLRYSQARAETMAAFLRESGIQVGEVLGVGGDRLLGDLKTEEGRGLNRRVELEVEVLPWEK